MYNSLETLNVSSIRKLVDSKIFESNHLNDNFIDLPCDGDER